MEDNSYAVVIGELEMPRRVTGFFDGRVAKHFASTYGRIHESLSLLPLASGRTVQKQTNIIVFTRRIRNGSSSWGAPARI